MGSISKSFALILVCALAMSSLSLVVKPVSADSYSLFWKSTLSYPVRPYKLAPVSWSYPIVVDGIVYVSSQSSFINSTATATSPQLLIYPFSDIYALNATTGAEIWDYRDNSTIFYDSPAVDNGVLLFGSTSSSRNYFGALNATNGLSLWNYTLSGGGWEITSSPVFTNGVVYIGAFSGLSGGLYALNETNGDEIWIFPINGGVASSPNVVDGVVYVASRIDNNIYALEATTGEQLWNYSAGAEPIYVPVGDLSPAVADGAVYVGGDGNLYALNAANGAKLWDYSIANGVFSPVVVNDAVYVLSTSLSFYTGIGEPEHANVYAIRATDGSKIWNSSLVEGTVISSLVVDGGIVYVSVFNPPVSNEAGIYALNTYDGEQLWTLPMPSNPTVINGILYFGYSDGQVYAYSVSPVPSPTPTTVSPIPSPTPTTGSPSPSIPEFPSTAILATFSVLSLFAVTMLTIRKRKIPSAFKS